MKHIKRIDEGFGKNFSRTLDFEKLYADKINNELINDLFDLSLEHLDDGFVLIINGYIKTNTNIYNYFRRLPNLRIGKVGDFVIFSQAIDHNHNDIEWSKINSDRLKGLALNGIKNIFNTIDSFVKDLRNKDIYYEFSYINTKYEISDRAIEWTDNEIEKTIKDMYPNEYISVDRNIIKRIL